MATKSMSHTLFIHFLALALSYEPLVGHHYDGCKVCAEASTRAYSGLVLHFLVSLLLFYQSGVAEQSAQRYTEHGQIGTHLYSVGDYGDRAFLWVLLAITVPSTDIILIRRGTDGRQACGGWRAKGGMASQVSARRVAR